MSLLFLSHSSQDNAATKALQNWLKREGWSDVFFDLDPERGIAAGERWERALHQAAHRCEAVLFLISRAWLASGWCLKEFDLAHRLNKQMFGVLIEDIPVADLPVNLTATWQLANLAAGRDHELFQVMLPYAQQEEHVTFSNEGLRSLRVGLRRAGLDPTVFAWPPATDPDRPPYPGLRPLEAQDAGIFFGREAPTIEALDRLRALRSGVGPRLLCILGASGSGKSSFLRAGLWPRLSRDDRNFLTLPVLRPERAALSGKAGLLAVLGEACAAQRLTLSRAELRVAIENGATTVRPILARLAEAAYGSASNETELLTADTRPPLLVLPIDQGEELFLDGGIDEGGAVLSLLSELLREDAPTLAVVLTIRSDAFERIQLAPALEGLNVQTMTFGPMPRGVYGTIIEGPAARMREAGRGLAIEPALTAALLTDMEAGRGRDVLPLLAFTLERLWLDYGGRGRLTLSDYESLGRVRGSIEAAVNEAFRRADYDPRLPRDSAARLTLLRRGLIPWLAGIDTETGSPRRRVARLAEIPEEARPLIDLLVEARLLSADTDPVTGEATVEPAHEALLRQWGLLEGWLAEDFGALTTLAGVARAALEWDANAQSPAWLAHDGERLVDAERLFERHDLAAQLGLAERDYLKACRDRTNREIAEIRTRVERDAAEARTRARLRQALQWGSIAAALVLAMLAGWAWSQRQDAIAAGLEAKRQQTEAELQRSVAEAQTRVAERETQNVKDRTAEVERGKTEAERLRRIAEQQSELATQQEREAQAQRIAAQEREVQARANQSAALAAISSTALDVDPVKALKLALASWPRSIDDPSPKLDVALAALSAAVQRFRERRVFIGHTDKIESVAFSPDGSRVLTASDDRTVRLWDAATGQQIQTFGISGVKSASVSPDGARVLTVADDRTVHLWDTATGQQIRVFEGHTKRVRSAVFSPDGTRVLTASEDRTSRLWDAATGRQLQLLEGHTSFVRSAVFSPDGTRVLTLSDEAEHTARLWNVATGRQLQIFKGHTDPINSAVFSLDGNRVLTASDDRTARLWDAATGRQLQAFGGHMRFVNSAVISPDGARVLTASGNTAYIWDAATGREFKVLKGHTDYVRSAFFLPFGFHVVTASDDGTARLWDVLAEREIQVFKGYKAALAPDGTRLLTASLNWTVHLWDILTGRELQILKGSDSVVSKTSDLVLSLDGTGVLIGSDEAIRVWNSDKGRELRTLKGHISRVNSAVFSSDGARVLSASDDQTSRLWDVTTGKQVQIFEGHTKRVISAVFSLNGTRVLTASQDLTARLWDAATGRQIQIFDISRANTVGVSHDGTRVLTALEDRTARLSDGANGRQLQTFNGHTDRVTNAALSLDGTRVLTASDDLTARLWDTATGREIQLFKGDRDQVKNARFSPDGARVLTASGNTASLRDATTGQQLQIFEGHSHQVNSASFSPDGARVLTASGNTVHLWDAATGHQLQVFKGPKDAVIAGEFSPDGTRILTTSGDNTARLWDTATGTGLLILRGHTGVVFRAVYSSTGNRVLTTSADETIRVWDVSSIATGSVFQIGCKWLPNHDLSGLATEYGFANLSPICAADPPLTK